MAKQSNSSGSDFMAGLFVGGLIGAVVGFLFAPRSGEETRSRLGERGIELRDELQKRAGDLQEKLPSFVEEQRSRVEEAIEKGKEAAARKRQEILTQAEGEKKEDASA